LNEALVWLLYGLAGALSYAAVYYRRWHIAGATLASAILALAIWTAWYLLTSEEKRPPWINVHLSLNAFFSLLFAVGGAALAEYLRRRNRGT
jgi:uncharacterized membrane protein YhaH (DUF805 family)